MNVTRIEVGVFESNCYLLTGGGSEALLVDPGADAPLIRSEIEAAGVRMAAVLLTHGHIDHLSALDELLREQPVPVYMHPLDQAWAFGPTNGYPPFYPASARAPADLRPLTDGQALELAGMRCVVIATPGHSPGGVCFHFPAEGELFTGDTLFQDTVGRTDLPGGDPRVLAESMKKLARLPGPTRVRPGHGPETTIAAEILHNYFMTAAARSARGPARPEPD